MQEIYVESLGKILQNKNKLEKELEVKITNRGRNIFINGEGDKEYIACRVIEALDLGFSIDSALQLKDEEIIFNIISIKNLTKRKDLKNIKARIIGTCGKTLKNLNQLSECTICLHDNKVGIIGNVEDIPEANKAIESIIHGSKQGNVYAKLEKIKRQKRIEKKIKLSNR